MKRTFTAQEKEFIFDTWKIVIPPLLASAKSRGFLCYSNCLGGTPPIAECGRTLL